MRRLWTQSPGVLVALIAGAVLWAALAGLLAGCATVPTSEPMPDGVETAPPQGWFGYCLDNLYDPRCLPADPLPGRQDRA